MNKKDIIMIYEDPITKQKPEGKAKLLKLTKAGTSTERWKVRFLSDDFVTERMVANGN